jgi:regulator of cell morphogenesis and NO signaling
LGDLVAESPRRAAVLDRLGLDFCCRGQRTLEQACREAGLPLESALAAISSADTDGTDATAAAPGPQGSEPLDLAHAPELFEAIVARHHRYLREEMPALVELAGKVAGVHGDRHPELAEVRRLVAALRDDLLPHMDNEELVLFPAIRRFAAGDRTFPFGAIGNPIRVMVAEHEAAGELLARLGRVTGGYDPPADGCASYQAFYARLAHLEADTHLHIHTEQNVLFPLVLAADTAA